MDWSSGSSWTRSKTYDPVFEEADGLVAFFLKNAINCFDDPVQVYAGL